MNTLSNLVKEILDYYQKVHRLKTKLFYNGKA